MKVYLLCNAHIDPMWQWEWEEGAASAVSTFRCAADFCEEFDGFVFNHNEALLYRWIEEYEPPLFQRIVRLVKEGKWNIMGGWTLQPDCNLPSGESIIGQIQDGTAYFQEKFGVRPRVAVNVDSFGHSRGLVQILRKCGYEGYLFMRPQKHLLTLPAADFLWEGYDGETIQVHRFDHWYNSPLGKAADKISAFVEEGKAAGKENMLILWGVGDHGGGPSRIDLRAIEELRARLVADGTAQLINAGAEDYFRTVDTSTLPLYKGMLHHSMQGCYSSQVLVKQAHRRLECQIAFCKAIGSAAAMNGLARYPREEIERAARDLYFSQFHDLLPGSSIREVEETGLQVMAHAMRELADVRMRMFFALAQCKEKAEEGHIPILVFNPHPYEWETEIDCEFMLADQNQDHSFVYVARVRDEEGALLPSQMEKERSNVNFDWRKRVVFRAKLKPSCVSRFDCEMVKQEMQYGERDWRGLPYQISEAPLKEDLVFAGDGWKVTISHTTGLISSYQIAGRELLHGEAGVLQVFADSSDPWGMAPMRMREPVGRFTLADEETTQCVCGTDRPLTPVRVVENGDVRTVVEAVFVHHHSWAVVTYTIPRQGGFVDMDIQLMVQEKDRMIKACFPLALEPENTFMAEDMFGRAVYDREEGEQSIHRWAALFDRKAAVTVINDGVYAADCYEDSLRITLLRTPAYTAHPTDDNWHIVPFGRYMPHSDQGERRFRLRLAGGEAGERLEHVQNEAAAFNMKPYALSFFPCGEGKTALEGVSLSDPAVELTCVEQREDGGYLLRLFNPCAAPRRVTVQVKAIGLTDTVTLPATSVETFRCQKGRLTPTDMLGNIL